MWVYAQALIQHTVLELCFLGGLGPGGKEREDRQAGEKRTTEREDEKEERPGEPGCALGKVADKGKVNQRRPFRGISDCPTEGALGTDENSCARSCHPILSRGAPMHLGAKSTLQALDGRMLALCRLHEDPDLPAWPPRAVDSGRVVSVGWNKGVLVWR